jgi:uncharacterized membrane protein YecN with MAPEG domain
MQASLPLATALWGGLLALFGLGLGAWVIRRRARSNIHFGDGDNADMQRAMRVHANFTEYVPLALIAMALAEMTGIMHLVIHVLGVLLLVARILHAWGLATNAGRSFGRAAGVTLTFAVLAAAGIAAIIGYLRHATL